MILSILLSLGLHQQVDTTQLSAELEEVTIRTTFRKESVGSLNLQSKTSVNMIDGMSSEIIKKSPDRNLGETLKRVGGITIQGTMHYHPHPLLSKGLHVDLGTHNEK